jgi:ABC-2 type transport system ATP-binding protein
VLGIRVEGLEKRFGSRVAVEGLTFSVAPGEVFGLLGPNGAGKTTTVRMLTGLLRPSGGTASVCGVGLPLKDEGVALRRKVGLLTESPGLYDRLTAKENLEFFIRLNEVDSAQAWKLATSLLERFGLAGRENEPVGGFSKGMRQKLAIVRALVHSPEVVFLDEPTSGLDPQSGRAVRDAIAELAREGRTMVLCSHNLAEVERLCTRVAVIRNSLRTVASLRELKREGLALDLEVEGDPHVYVWSLSSLPFRVSHQVDGSRLRVFMDTESQGPDVIACVVMAGARLRSAHRAARPLEEAYLELVQEEEVS